MKIYSPFIFLLFSISVFAQTNYQAYKMQAGVLSKNGWNWGDTFSVKFSVIVKDSVTVINDTPQTSIHCVRYLTARADSTNKADKFIQYLWGAVDQNNKRCFYATVVHEKKDFNSIEVYYKDYCFRYFVKPD